MKKISEIIPAIEIKGTLPTFYAEAGDF